MFSACFSSTKIKKQKLTAHCLWFLYNSCKFNVRIFEIIKHSMYKLIKNYEYNYLHKSYLLIT